MEDHKYTELFALQSVPLTGPTKFCPEDQEIAEYFDGVIPKDEQGRLERHLADCRYCLAQVGILGRLEDHGVDRRISGDVLATAKAMVHKAPGRWQKMAPAWAVAALLILGIGVLPIMYSTPHDNQAQIGSPSEVGHSSEQRETRNINSTVTGPGFLSPVEGPAIVPADHLFRWTTVPDCRFYQVRILTDNGDLLWQERITGTEWKLPAGTLLKPGAEYFVRVEAFLADTRSLKSEYLLFQVEEQR